MLLADWFRQIYKPTNKQTNKQIYKKKHFKFKYKFEKYLWAEVLLADWFRQGESIVGVVDGVTIRCKYMIINNFD